MDRYDSIDRKEKSDRNGFLNFKFYLKSNFGLLFYFIINFKVLILNEIKSELILSD